MKDELFPPSPLLFVTVHTQPPKLDSTIVLLASELWKPVVQGKRCVCSWTLDFQGTLSDRREMNEFLARGVISTHLSLGRKGCMRVNEKSYVRRAVRYTTALRNMLSLLSEPPPNFNTQRPKSFSKTSTHNQYCPGIPGAPLGEGEAQNLPIMGIHI